jgi:hypothetical protein
MRLTQAFGYVLAGILIAGCSSDATSPASSLRQSASASSAEWGPETPHFNLEVVLRGDGFGLVKFRQPNDDSRIVNLGVSVRGLQPNTAYKLQRAVDTNLDKVCTSTSWLTLGKGLVPQSITTDDRGSASEDLFRDLGAFAPGTTFDIHFQVVDATTGAVVLTSECYQFTVSQ